MNKYKIIFNSINQYIDINIKSDLSIEELNRLIHVSINNSKKFIILDNCIINIDQILYIDLL